MTFILELCNSCQSISYLHIPKIRREKKTNKKKWGGGDELLLYLQFLSSHLLVSLNLPLLLVHFHSWWKSNFQIRLTCVESFSFIKSCFSKQMLSEYSDHEDIVVQTRNSCRQMFGSQGVCWDATCHHRITFLRAGKEGGVQCVSTFWCSQALVVFHPFG